MRVHLSNCGAIHLVEPNNFRALDVLVDPQPAERLEQAIARQQEKGRDAARVAVEMANLLESLE